MGRRLINILVAHLQGFQQQVQKIQKTALLFILQAGILMARELKLKPVHMGFHDVDPVNGS